MDESAEESNSELPRRKVLAGSAGIATALAGCASTSSSPSDSGDSGGDDSRSVELLKLGGSSTVYPIVNKAGSLWSANYPASGDESWNPGKYDIQTDKKLANYWASKYGFETSDGGPPFEISIGLSNSGTGLDKLRKGQVDIGNASAPVVTELPDLSEKEKKKFKDHVIGVGTSPIVVSREVYDAGIEMLTAEEAADIYRGKITDWTQIDRYDGPKSEIQAIGRTPGSATEGLFKKHVLGDADGEMPGVDVRKGENQQVQTVVANSNNAIGYLALAFVSEQAPAIGLKVDGTVYKPGKNLSDPGYPLARDLHCYTYGGTSNKEAAFLRMILSDFGQKEFVAPAGYSTLTDERQKEEIGRLPEPEA